MAVRRAVFLCLLVLAGLSLVHAAPIVLLGSDYLHTLPGTMFAGVPFNGVPVGPGNTDTVVRRLTDATFAGVGSSDTIPIEMVQLNLVSAVPVDFGLGLGFYYITLQSARGGPASAGRMTINYAVADDQLPNTPEGTFDSFFDVFFDIRLGALDGPIALSDMLTLTSNGSLWDADPPPSVVIVSGLAGDILANLHTDKGPDQLDFFPLKITEVHPSGAVHVVELSTPEPESWLTLAAGLGALLAARRRRSILG